MDACAGDSGGPLILNREDSRAQVGQLLMSHLAGEYSSQSAAGSVSHMVNESFGQLGM